MTEAAKGSAVLLCKGRDVLNRGSLPHVSSDSIGAKAGGALTHPVLFDTGTGPNPTRRVG